MSCREHVPDEGRNEMLHSTVKRVLLMIPTLASVMLITFTFTQFVPGGPVEKLITEIEGHGKGGREVGITGTSMYCGNSGLDGERVSKLKEQYGFDKPPLERFLTMMGDYLVFDFGTSYYHHRSVFSLVVSKMPVSMSLGIWSFLIVYGVCIPLGIKKAVQDGSRFDLVSSTAIMVGYAIPGFVLGVALIVLFGGGSFWNIFPLRGLVSDNWAEMTLVSQILDCLWHMVLPITASVVEISLL